MLDKYFPAYALCFLTTLLLTVIIEKKLIPVFSKKAQQPIYEEGPRWHIAKSGTPTMGGVAFLIAASFSILLCSLFLFLNKNYDSAISLLISLLFAFGNAMIGVIDDMTKLRKKENAGLSPKQKLLLQLILSVLFISARSLILNDGTSLQFSFGEIELGLFYYPLSVFILLGIVNSANLTDGIDGLASSVAFSIGVSLFYIGAALNPELSFLSSAIIGASVGFLLFNVHPAKIFMGDTGSLFFGALIASSAHLLKNPVMIIFIAGVYVIEGFSVVLQVIVYKITKKRVFKMAPLHHHLEKSNFSENKICLCAILLTFLFSIPAYIFYLP